jgi:hypothetical protein
MLLNVAIARGGIAGGAPALGGGRHGTAGRARSRFAPQFAVHWQPVYTGLGQDELYVVVRGKDLPALADALDVIIGADNVLQEYAQGRRAAWASV